MLVWQPYGRGKGIAFLPQDSWEWQMHASIPLEDMTHENLWRQMLRWLVADSPAPVEASTTTDRVEPGEAVTIEASVVDPTWLDVNDARVSARVSRPGARGICGQAAPGPRRYATSVRRRSRSWELSKPDARSGDGSPRTAMPRGSMLPWTL